MPGQLFDAAREQCDLHRSRPLVVLASRELLYDFLLSCLFHVSLLSVDSASRFQSGGQPGVRRDPAAPLHIQSIKLESGQAHVKACVAMHAPGPRRRLPAKRALTGRQGAWRPPSPGRGSTAPSSAPGSARTADPNAVIAIRTVTQIPAAAPASGSQTWRRRLGHPARGAVGRDTPTRCGSGSSGSDLDRSSIRTRRPR